MKKFKAFILITLAFTILINCNSPQSSFLSDTNWESVNQKNNTNDTVYIYESDYKVIFSENERIKIEIINKNLLNRLSNHINPTIIFFYNNRSYTAKGIEIYSSELPHDCDYFFYIKKKKIWLSEGNILVFRKIKPPTPAPTPPARNF